MLSATQIQTTTHNIPQQITVYCCCWHICAVTTLTLQLTTHLPDILISVTQCQLVPGTLYHLHSFIHSLEVCGTWRTVSEMRVARCSSAPVVYCPPHSSRFASAPLTVSQCTSAMVCRYLVYISSCSTTRLRLSSKRDATFKSSCSKKSSITVHYLVQLFTEQLTVSSRNITCSFVQLTHTFTAEQI